MGCTQYLEHHWQHDYNKRYGNNQYGNSQSMADYETHHEDLAYLVAVRPRWRSITLFQLSVPNHTQTPDTFEKHHALKKYERE
jgi:hypothetical protein